MEFKAWPKIIRIENKRAPIFTEKIDGTNACIAIQYVGRDPAICMREWGCYAFQKNDGNTACLYVQSRNRHINPTEDNYGFASWVYANAQELEKLGEGYHYGEWWGLGIGRGYDLTEKRFSLFNTRRWGKHNPNTPACVSVVPMLPCSSVEETRMYLTNNGSIVAPGYMRPEGAVMYEPDTDTYFKIIMDK